jgi:hypothetical protein
MFAVRLITNTTAFVLSLTGPMGITFGSYADAMSFTTAADAAEFAVSLDDSEDFEVVRIFTTTGGATRIARVED